MSVYSVYTCIVFVHFSCSEISVIHNISVSYKQAYKDLKLTVGKSVKTTRMT